MKHPEDTCQRCGRPNAGSWHAPSPLWNFVMRDPRGADRYSIVCPTCFMQLAEEQGVGTGPPWCLKPHDTDIGDLWRDPDGRKWDEEQCLWVEPS